MTINVETNNGNRKSQFQAGVVNGSKPGGSICRTYCHYPRTSLLQIIHQLQRVNGNFTVKKLADRHQHDRVIKVVGQVDIMCSLIRGTEKSTPFI